MVGPTSIEVKCEDITILEGMAFIMNGLDYLYVGPTVELWRLVTLEACNKIRIRVYVPELGPPFISEAPVTILLSHYLPLGSMLYSLNLHLLDWVLRKLNYDTIKLERS